jgi:hypothetical protein
MGRHAERMGEMKNAYKSLLHSVKGRYHPEDIGINVKIILK